MEKRKLEKPIAVYGAIAANALIAVIKFIVAAAIGSSAMLSEAIHSTADTGNELLLLVGIHRSQKPADRLHPVGYGREVYFWGLIVAVILFGLGGGMSIYEGITRFSEPFKPNNPIWNYLVLTVSFIIEGISFYIAFIKLLEKKRPEESIWQTLHKSKDPGIFIVIGENTADLLGLVVAFLGIFLSEQLKSIYPDAIASILIGVILAVIAIYLAGESKSLLIGESASFQLVEEVHQMVLSNPAVEQADPPLSVQLDPYEVFIAMDIRLRGNVPAAEVVHTIKKIEQDIHENHPSVGRVYIQLKDGEKDAASDQDGAQKA